jgi:hypothetical protein
LRGIQEHNSSYDDQPTKPGSVSDLLIDACGLTAACDLLFTIGIVSRFVIDASILLCRSNSNCENDIASEIFPARAAGLNLTVSACGAGSRTAAPSTGAVAAILGAATTSAASSGGLI